MVAIGQTAALVVQTMLTVLTQNSGFRSSAGCIQ
jgi:hypothetical protein